MFWRTGISASAIFSSNEMFFHGGACGSPCRPHVLHSSSGSGTGEIGVTAWVFERNGPKVDANPAAIEFWMNFLLNIIGQLQTQKLSLFLYYILRNKRIEQWQQFD